MLMLAFISWNENNNGFDLVGLNFFFLSIGVWRFYLFCCCILYFLFGCLFSEMMKYLHIARHLAAKFGTFFAHLILEVVFTMDGRYLDVVFFLYICFNKC